MLIRASGAIHPGFYLVSLGETCRYILGSPDGTLGTDSFAIFDPGLSGQWPFLLRRLAAWGFSTEKLAAVFITHLDADRIGAIPSLRRACPRARIYGSSEMQQRLTDPAFAANLYLQDLSLCKELEIEPQILDQGEFCGLLSITDVLIESDLMPFSEDIGLRVLSAPGHTDHSLAYFIIPFEFLIADEVVGYHRGRELAAPGADHSLEAAQHALEKLVQLEMAGLCLPAAGMLTGALVRKHLLALRQNIDDLQNEVKKALEAGISIEQVKQNVRTSFYTSDSLDPIVRRNLDQSFNRICAQLEIA